MENIIIRGLKENNIKGIDLTIPKGKLIVVTGVSGSGKSTIVFDTIAAESQRQMNETYPAFIRSKLPQYKKPNVSSISNLAPSVIVDQSTIGGNVRSTVGTITDIYSDLRVLFSRIGQPCVGSASHFSFNDPKGMCLTCSGIGRVMRVMVEKVIDFEKSINEGCFIDSTYSVGTWYWKQYVESGLFDLDKPIKDYTNSELTLFLHGENSKKKKDFIGIIKKYEQIYIHRDMSSMSQSTKEKAAEYTCLEPCDTCGGKRLNHAALNCKINGYSIADFCSMDMLVLKKCIKEITNETVTSLLSAVEASVDRMIEIGLSYLHLNRETNTLSGGEGQRLKLIRYMGSSLTDMIYIFDEPTTGMHAYDVEKICRLLVALKQKGNSVIVVEHDQEIMKIADEIIDVGPFAGKYGGEVVFQGTYENLCHASTVTGREIGQPVPVKEQVRKAEGGLKIQNASRYNLKNISVEFPLHTLTVVTGVAGSGKSTLVTKLLYEKYHQELTLIDQKPVFATNRSTPATFIGIFDAIRKIFAFANSVESNLFSFNSKGACRTCLGKGVVVTELVHMSPVVTTCESCHGTRYQHQTLELKYKGKTIVEVLNMSVEEAIIFFSDETKLVKKLQLLEEVGLPYMTLGQPLSTLSGGEVQRVKLAKYLSKKKQVIILDEPTKGLHASDVKGLLSLLNKLVDKGNSIIVVEHNLDVIKQADYIIDVGPFGGDQGGEIVFTGTPKEMVAFSHTTTAECVKQSLSIR